jgi:hypothetical protein
MKTQLGRRAALDLSEEIQKLLGSMSRGDSAPYLSGHDVERGVQP